jgi:DNA invertase Pin-like site-specific DNA recombinase
MIDFWYVKPHKDLEAMVRKRGKQMIVGYARTSTIEQKAGYEAQIAELTQAGCTKLFKEQVSSVDVAAREQLSLALDFVREGDVFVVTKLDRLARSMANLMQIAAQLEAKGASLRILNLGVDTATPTGKLILTVMGGIAQFEREIMLERQREGIAKAKSEGKFKGRKPTARAKADEIQALRSSGIMPTEIAKRLGIGRQSVYRILDEVAAAA